LGYLGGKKILDSVRNTQVYYINIPWQQEAEGLLEEAKEGHVDVD